MSNKYSFAPLRSVILVVLALSISIGCQKKQESQTAPSDPNLAKSLQQQEERTQVAIDTRNCLSKNEKGQFKCVTDDENAFINYYGKYDRKYPESTDQFIDLQNIATVDVHPVKISNTEYCNISNHTDKKVACWGLYLTPVLGVEKSTDEKGKKYYLDNWLIAPVATDKEQAYLYRQLLLLALRRIEPHQAHLVEAALGKKLTQGFGIIENARTFNVRYPIRFMNFLHYDNSPYKFEMHPDDKRKKASYGIIEFMLNLNGTEFHFKIGQEEPWKKGEDELINSIVAPFN